MAFVRSNPLFKKVTIVGDNAETYVHCFARKCTNIDGIFLSVFYRNGDNEVS